MDLRALLHGMLTAGGEMNLVREIEELEAAANRLLVQASASLRSGRSGWEPWFEAGMELQEAANRLRRCLQAGEPPFAVIKPQERRKRS